MTAALKDLLDDLSAEVVQDVPIDLNDVQVRVSRRRFRVRVWGATTGLAAAVALIGLLAVTTVLPLVPQPAATGGDVGLPRSWYPAPTYVPTIGPGQMAAASMLLTVAFLHYGDNERVPNWPVLVSADGRTYARLPDGSDLGPSALSADGRQVAWVGVGTDKKAVLHRLRLVDAHDVVVGLGADPGSVYGVQWAGDRIVISVADRPNNTLRSIAVAGTTFEQIGCGFPRGVDAEGTPVFVLPMEIGALGGSRRCRADQEFSTTPPSVVDPTGHAEAQVVNPGDGDSGTAAASLDHAVLAVWDAEGMHQYPLRAVGGAPVEKATTGEVLAWTSAGILTRVRFANGRESSQGWLNGGVSLQLFDPASHTWTPVGRTDRMYPAPYSVASDLAGRPTVAGAAPSVPWYSSARVGHATSRFWAAHGSWIGSSAGVLVVLALGIAVGRRSRRRVGETERRETDLP